MVCESRGIFQNRLYWGWGTVGLAFELRARDVVIKDNQTTSSVKDLELHFIIFRDNPMVEASL